MPEVDIDRNEDRIKKPLPGFELGVEPSIDTRFPSCWRAMLRRDGPLPTATHGARPLHNVAPNWLA